MTKLTIPVEKHAAFPVFALTAYNNRHFGKSTGFKLGNISVFSDEYEPNNLLLPNGGKNYTAEIMNLGLIKESKKGYEVTEKGKKVLEKVIQWGDFSAWAKPKPILTEQPNPLNADIMIYLNQNGSTEYCKLKSDIENIYKDNKINRRVPFLKRFVGEKIAVMQESVERLFRYEYINADGYAMWDDVNKDKVKQYPNESTKKYCARRAKILLALEDKRKLDITEYGKYHLEDLEEIADAALAS